MAEGPTIFYSWQTDSPAALNRDYIRQNLDKAVTALDYKSSVEDAFRVTAGIEGESGTPEVAALIFKRIAAASLFVGDVTLVGFSDKNKKRGLPNPNVSIEMGFAAATLGWDRIICVMNESFGSRFALPFDHRNRRFPISYSRKSSSDESSELAETLAVALQAAETSVLLKVDRTMQRLDLDCLRLIHAFHRADFFSEPTLFSGDQVYTSFSQSHPTTARSWPYCIGYRRNKKNVRLSLDVRWEKSDRSIRAIVQILLKKIQSKQPKQMTLLPLAENWQ